MVLPDGAMSDADCAVPARGEVSLWAFAVDLYTAPGVAAACLGLQDQHGCDVNLLLFAAWMGAVRHRTMTAAEMAEAATAVEDWHAEIVRPLRGVRRRLKSGPPPAPDEASEALRTRIKSIEIEAERIELAVLEMLAAKWHVGDVKIGGASLENLCTAVRHFAGGEPLVQMLKLIQAIEKGVVVARVAFVAGNDA
jgi:uncharacterized protein (TIGR02444 family)